MASTSLAGRADSRWLRFLERAKQPRLVRAALRFSVIKGSLLAGGVTFAAMLSLAAAMTILVNVARYILRENPAMFLEVLRLVNQVLPGIFTLGGREGILEPSSLLLEPGFNWATFISALVLLWSSAMVMTGLRKSMRSMFGLGGAPLTFVYGKFVDLLGFVLLGLAILLSAAMVSGVTVGGEALLQWLGLRDRVNAVLAAAMALILSAVLDALVTWLLLRRIARVRVPRPDLVQAMAMGAVIFGVLRLAGTSVVGLFDNPLLASVTAVATLLLWINLAVRALLMICAWTANPPGADVPVDPVTVHAKETPNYVSLSAPHTLEWTFHPVTGALEPEQRSPAETDS